MLTFTLAISFLTAFNLPWFTDLTFQVPMQYCFLQYQTLLPSPVPLTTGCCFCFGSITSFFLELFLHWSPVAYWVPTDLGSSFFSVLSFCLFILFMGFSRQEYRSGLPFPSPVHHILPDVQAGLELPDVQAGFRKGRVTRSTKLPTSTGSSKKQESSRKTSISALLTMPKPLTVWITINCGKFWKRWNTRPPELPLEKTICRSGSNSYNWAWNNRLVPNRKRSTSRLYIVTLPI